MEPEVVAAMAEAAGSFARIGDLQDAASERHRGADRGRGRLRHVRRGGGADARCGGDAGPARPGPDGAPPRHGRRAVEIVVQRATAIRTTTSSARPARGSSSSATRTAATADEMDGLRSAPATAGAFFHGQAEAHGLPIDEFVRDRPRPRPAGPRRRLDEPAAAHQPAPLHRRRRRPRRVQRRQDDPRAPGVGVPRRSSRPARLGRPPAAGHGRHAGDLGPSLAARDRGHRAAAAARDRALDEDRQGGDRRAARRARALRRPRRGGRAAPLDGRSPSGWPPSWRGSPA